MSHVTMFADRSTFLQNEAKLARAAQTKISSNHENGKNNRTGQGSSGVTQASVVVTLRVSSRDEARVGQSDRVEAKRRRRRRERGFLSRPAPDPLFPLLTHEYMHDGETWHNEEEAIGTDGEN